MVILNGDIHNLAHGMIWCIPPFAVKTKMKSNPTVNVAERT